MDENVLDYIYRSIFPDKHFSFEDNRLFPHLHHDHHLSNKSNFLHDVLHKNVVMLLDLKHNPRHQNDNHVKQLSKFRIPRFSKISFQHTLKLYPNVIACDEFCSCKKRFKFSMIIYVSSSVLTNQSN